MPGTFYEIGQGHVRDVWEEDKDSGFYSSQRTHGTLSSDFVKRHAGTFVFGTEETPSDLRVPVARFGSLRESGKRLFEMESGSGDTWIIKNVPLYKAHPDNRKYGVSCDRKFIDRMIKNFYATRVATQQLFGDSEFAWLPKLHYGHTPNNPDLPERSNAGFIDNLFRVEDFLFGDLVGLDKAGLNTLMSGQYPDRSAEVDLKRARLLSVAALGFRTPHFALPQMRPDQLREKYRAMTAKHEIENVATEILLREDMPMATKTRKSQERLTASEVARFWAACQVDNELQEEFETLKDAAIAQYCSENKEKEPKGEDMEKIATKAMKALMEKRMNTDAAQNAGDFIDFESDAHHDNRVGFDEEGTGVAGPDDRGNRKGPMGEDSSVDSDGEPSADEGPGQGDTIDEGGNVVSRSVAAVTTKVKHSLGLIKDKHTRDQVGAAFSEVLQTMNNVAGFVEKQGAALTNLSRENARQRRNHRTAKFTGRLEKMFSSGNPNVTSKSQIDTHLSFLDDLPDEKAEAYLDNLERAISLPKGRRFSTLDEGAIRSTTQKDALDRAKHELKSNPQFSALGDLVTPEHLALVDMFSNMETVEDSADE
jgi:hypothetical protein